MKRLAIGILIGFILALSFSHAESTGKKILVYYETISKIMIDGKDMTPKDKKPFVYEGTTYVPLRFISEALGKTVQWDEETGTIYVGDKPVSIIGQKVYLTDLGISYFSNMNLYRIDNSTKEVYNRDFDASEDFPNDFTMTLKVDPITSKVEQYSKGISLKAYENYSSLVYKLDKKYGKLTGIAGFDALLSKDMDENYIIRFSADGVTKQEIEVKNGGFIPSIDVDLSDAKELSIQFIRTEGNKREPYINLVNMVLIPSTGK